MQNPIERRHFSVHGVVVQHLRQHPHHRVQPQTAPLPRRVRGLGGGRVGDEQLGQLEVNGGGRLADACTRGCSKVIGEFVF